jgi:TonB family protein
VNARITGVVILQVATGPTEGELLDVKVTRSIPQLDDAALAAVRLWQFEPAQLRGNPVPLSFSVSVNFTLPPP